jgi:hypothetical protein
MKAQLLLFTLLLVSCQSNTTQQTTSTVTSTRSVASSNKSTANPDQPDADIPAASGNWVRFTSGADNSTNEIDTQTLTKEGNTVKFWQRITYTEPQANGASMTTLFQTMDCTQQKSQALMQILSDGNGKVISVKNYKIQRLPVLPIQPGTPESDIYESVCR